MGDSVAFDEARPVWIKGREKEMNVQAGFETEFRALGGDRCMLRLTGSTLYRIRVNGVFVHYGPARAPHGFARVDEMDLSPYLHDGLNRIGIEVSGCNCHTYYTLNVPSFVQAEVLLDDRVAAATGEGGSFRAVELATRVQKVMRYSFQRNFIEVYRYDRPEAVDRWNCSLRHRPAELAEQSTGLRYLPREVPVPTYEMRYVRSIRQTGVVADKSGDAVIPELRFVDQISNVTTGYPRDQLDDFAFDTLWRSSFDSSADVHSEVDGRDMDVCIETRRYALLDLGWNNTGFIVSEIEALEDSEVYLIFDEKLAEGKLDREMREQLNIVKYTLKKNANPYRLESFECYGFRYVQIFVLEGSVRLRKLGLREYSYPSYRNAYMTTGDREIDAVFRAAAETFRQNTLDVFMDCPTRERAGWLCDSYFTAQAAQYFAGDSIVEKVMLESFVLPARFPGIPEGMLPMCYPAEHPDGNFIPQWALWYLIQLDGYFKRSGRDDRRTFERTAYRLLRYLEPFRNADGLLERLDKWNFIEWSEANEWVMDVHYPTNMLYSKALYLVGSWYRDDRLLTESRQVKERILEQSFDGEFFSDNAVRQADGKLVVTGNRSEVCQYYAFFFDIADPDSPRFAGLKKTVERVFGPHRKSRGLLPEVAAANAFIGNYLRMELLVRWRKYEQALEESRRYFYPMAELTGTLWEHDRIVGSLNHGFASVIGVILMKCLLGIQSIDESERKIVLDFSEQRISAEGAVGTRHGEVWVRQEVHQGKTRIYYRVPPEYECLIVNAPEELEPWAEILSRQVDGRE